MKQGGLLERRLGVAEAPQDAESVYLVPNRHAHEELPQRGVEVREGLLPVGVAHGGAVGGTHLADPVGPASRHHLRPSRTSGSPHPIFSRSWL